MYVDIPYSLQVSLDPFANKNENNTLAKEFYMVLELMSCELTTYSNKLMR